MKRISAASVAVAATAVVALGLAGCSSSGADSGGTITFMSTSTSKPAMEKVITAFEKANPGIKVRASYPTPDAFTTGLSTQISSGTAPDVFYATPGSSAISIGALEKNGYIENLSKLPFASKVPAGLKTSTQVDGKTMVLPMEVVGIGALYNEQAVAAAHAAIPTTFPEVLKFCDSAKASGKIAFALGLHDLWVNLLIPYALVATQVDSHNPSFDADMASGKVNFSDSGWKAALEDVMEMKSHGCFDAEPNATTFESTLQEVASGKALAVVQVSSSLAQLKKEGAPGTSFGTFALPGGTNASDTWIPESMGAAFAVNSKSKHLALAEKLIDFMASPSTTASYAENAGALPAIPTDQYKAAPELKVFLTAAKDGKTTPFMDLYWKSPKVQPALMQGSQQLFAGTATIAQVLKSMDDAYKNMN